MDLEMFFTIRLVHIIVLFLIELREIQSHGALAL
jgi:hypothetical protein